MSPSNPIALRNDRGEVVDPVPWIVVSGIAFLLCFGYLPIVFLTFGFAIEPILVFVSVLFVATAAIAFHRQIRLARPELAGEVPAHVRMRRLLLAVVIGVVALLSIQVAMVLFGPLPS